MSCFSLEGYLRRYFYWYGGISYKYRWPFFIVPIILTALLSTGFLSFGELEIDDPVDVFTPRDSRWKREFSTFARLWPLQENKFLPGKSFELKRFINILIKAKDGGSVLRPKILDEIEVLNRFIMENLTVPTYDKRFNLTYTDLCLNYDWVCSANEHIRMFKEMSQIGRVIELKYPRGGNKDTPVYLGTVIGDISLNRTDSTVIGAKITQLFYFLKQEPEIVASYSKDFEYAAERLVLSGFESSLISLSFAHYHSLKDGIDQNARRFVPNFVISFTALSIFCIGCAFHLKQNSKFAIDWTMFPLKGALACAGLVNTLLALVSAFGIMLLLGIPYNVVNTIIPFLIIAIGVDDMFVMNACWDQTDRELPPKIRLAKTMSAGGVAISITNITDILAFLIGCASELAGIEVFCLYAFASVLFCYIYQLTFFSGCLAIIGTGEYSKRIKLLCQKAKEIPPPFDNHCNGLSGAKVSNLLGRDDDGLPRIFHVDKQRFKRDQLQSNGDRATICSNQTKSNSLPSVDDEKSAKNSTDGSATVLEDIFVSKKNGCGCLCELHSKTNNSKCQQANKSQEEKASNRVFLFWKIVAANICCRKTEKSSQFEAFGTKNSSNATHRFFGECFGPLILNNYMRVLILTLYCSYIFGAVVGCLHFKEGLEPSHLVTTDHYIGRYFDDMKVFWKTGPQLHVAILSPPRLTDPIQRQQLMALVRAFENTEYTMGREGTVFFLLEYMNYLNQLNAELNNDRIWDQKLRDWLKYTGASNQWKTDIVMTRQNNDFEAYRFQIAMKDIVEPNQHKLAAKMLREIADQQPFHVEIYHEAFPFADQYLIILPSTIKNVLISLMVMTIIAFLLIPSCSSAVIIILSIISICTGVFGYMTFWGVNLDAVSMISIIMSIGFAVDLSAHIVYAFVAAHGDNTKRRLFEALEHIGWPIFQGAASTIVGVSVLYSVDAYIILTFFKTIWLTMTLGLIHALIFVPVFISFIPLNFFQLA